MGWNDLAGWQQAAILGFWLVLVGQGVRWVADMVVRVALTLERIEGSLAGWETRRQEWINYREVQQEEAERCLRYNLEAHRARQNAQEGPQEPRGATQTQG